MKIKIVHYPYREYKIGDIVDLGEEINNSLISFDRAVLALDQTPSTFQEKIRETIKEITTPLSKPKKILNNDLRDQVVEVKKRASFK